MSAKSVIAAAFILVTMATPAMALELRPYVFGSVGVGESDLGEFEAQYDAFVSEISRNGGSNHLDIDDRDTVATLGLGLGLHRYFALELSYYYLGNYDIKAQGHVSNGDGQMSQRSSARAKVRGLGIQGVFIAPITSRLSATLSLGVANIETDIESQYSYRQERREFVQTGGERDDRRFRDTVGNIGAGARYALTDALSLRIDYQYLGSVGGYYEAEESLNALSAGMTYHF